MQCCASASTLQLFTCRHVAPVFRHCRGRPCPRPWGTKRSVAVPQLLALAFLGETEAPRLGQGQPHRGAALPEPQARAQSATTPRSSSAQRLVPVTNSAGNATTPSKTPKAKCQVSRPSCSSWGAAPPSFSPHFLGGLFPSLSLPGGLPNLPRVSKRPPRLHSRPPGGSTSPGGAAQRPEPPEGRPAGQGLPPQLPPASSPVPPPLNPSQPHGEGAAGALPGQVLQDLLLDEAGHASHGGGRLSAEAGGAPSPLRRLLLLLPARSAPAAASRSPPAGPTGLGPSPPGG